MQKERTSLQIMRTRLLENRAWVDENVEKLRNDYHDKWIAVLDRKVIKEGIDPYDVKEALKGREEEGLLIKMPAVIAKPM
ncbi:MAG: hypothetical protein Q8Q41_01530 [bacterium]|nr:hypothetical protein [bacterium]